MVAHESTFPVSTRLDAGRLPSTKSGKLASMRGQTSVAGDLVHRAAVELGLRMNGSFFYPSEDRSILECLIIPYYQISAEHRRILSIGTDWYTQGYDRMFALKDMSTLDVDPAAARYGAPRHIVGPMSVISDHFVPSALDLIICNGVVGWGLDTAADAQASFAAAFDALRPGGHLIVGWNDLEKHRPFDLSEIPAIRRFESWKFPPLRTAQHLVDNAWRHTFNFYKKPDAA